MTDNLLGTDTRDILANNALKRFEEHKENPMVQGLLSFITKTNHLPQDVFSWSIELPAEEMGMPYSPHTVEQEKSMMQAMYGNVRRFHVRFKGDAARYTGYDGWLKERNDQTWVVWAYNAVVTVMGNA